MAQLLPFDQFATDAPALDLTDPQSLSERTPPSRRPFTVEVIRSAKRKKSSQARLRDDVLEVRIPAWFSGSQEQDTVDHFVKKFERAHASKLVDLDSRAAKLAAELDLPLPTSITWVSNQRDRWGSCTPAHGTVRISDRLADFPTWVIDYVVVHELAHLLESNHGERFWAIVARYPLSERARGYLLAKGHDGC